ncbi:aminoglycoside phosphotransferase family protein [Kribbella solani]|nr:aminoglycoside phosphotransferase family protein [Kribbella solani]
MRELINWATTATGRVIAVNPLHGDEGPWRLHAIHNGVNRQYILRAPTSRIDQSMIATNATALQLAEHHDLPAPRLIAADLAGNQSGTPASLETAVAGTTNWPNSSPERLRAAGAALARLHTIPMAPREHLPFRPRPIAVDDFATDRRTGRMPTTPLLQQADALIRAHGLPEEPSVYLHGDVWPGNMLWSNHQVTAFIDWKTAGVGALGVDLSELRKQVAITFGPQAPTEVLTGYQHATGHPAPHVAYWDAVAALNTPTTCWTPTATLRRNDFLDEALRNLP